MCVECVCVQSFSCLVSLLFFFDLIVSIELNFCQACDESLSRNSTAVVEASSTMSAINVCRVCVCAVFFVSCHYFFFDLIVSIELNFCQVYDGSLSRNNNAVVEMTPMIAHFWHPPSTTGMEQCCDVRSGFALLKSAHYGPPQ